MHRVSVEVTIMLWIYGNHILGYEWLGLLNIEQAKVKSK